MLEPLGEETKSSTVPMDDLDEVGSGAASEHKQMAEERILLQYTLHQHRQTVDALTHVDKAKCQMHLHAGGKQRHAMASSADEVASVISTDTNVGTVTAANSTFHRRRTRGSMP